MEEEEIIPIEMFCSFYNVEPSFLETLESHGLISINQKDDQRFIFREEVVELEKFSRLYYDLNINAAGIDALKNLLDKIKLLQQEAALLRARLRIYE